MQNLNTEVIAATPVYAAGAYILREFLENQKQIQESYPASRLILATSEQDHKKELIRLLGDHCVKGAVISYDIEKPDYARDRIWNITSGREAIRKHFLSHENAEYLLFLDSDMLFEASIIEKMLSQIYGYDIVFSGYPLKNYGTGLAGCGCVMLRRAVMEKVKFRCYEFKNGQVIFEDNMLEMDAYISGFRIKRGFFAGIKHYFSAMQFKSQSPQNTTLLQKVINCSLLRYLLIRLSIMARFNLPWYLKRLFFT